MFKQSLWALAAAALFSFMAAFVKLCSDQLGPLELVFYRSLFGVISIALFVYKSKLSVRTPYLWGHIKRSVLGTLSVALWFYAIGSTRRRSSWRRTSRSSPSCAASARPGF